MRHVLALTALGLALPALAHAQSPQQQQQLLQQQQRAFEAQQAIAQQQFQQQYIQSQRLEQLQRDQDNLELRLRTQQAQNDALVQRAQAPPPPQVTWIPPAAPALPADLAAAEARREASIAASEERLKIIADKLKK